MKITVGWWEDRKGRKWHVDWVGETRAVGHRITEDPEDPEALALWRPNGRPNTMEDPTDLISRCDTSEFDDGGPAFPVPANDATDGRTHDGGMTLRDWFAGQALNGILSKLPLIDQTGELGESVPDKIKLNDDIADRSYCIADAMLKARKK